MATRRAVVTLDGPDRELMIINQEGNNTPAARLSAKGRHTPHVLLRAGRCTYFEFSGFLGSLVVDLHPYWDLLERACALEWRLYIRALPRRALLPRPPTSQQATLSALLVVVFLAFVLLSSSSSLFLSLSLLSFLLSPVVALYAQACPATGAYTYLSRPRSERAPRPQNVQTRSVH